MTTWNSGFRESEEPEAPLYCANHPTVETYLRCAKCEKPICARCRVSTPVGFRCFECARLQVLPTYAVSGDLYVRAALLGLIAATIAGILMGFLPNFEFWAALLMAIAVPEAVAVASNQKRSTGLQGVAVASIVVGFAVSRIVMEVFDTAERYKFISRAPDSRTPEIFQDLPFYFTQYTVLWLAMAAFFAYRRLQ